MDSNIIRLEDKKIKNQSFEEFCIFTTESRNYELRITNYELRITNQELGTINY